MRCLQIVSWGESVPPMGPVRRGLEVTVLLVAIIIAARGFPARGAVTQLPPVTIDDRKALLIKSNDPTEEQLALMGPGQAPGWLFRTAAGAERDIISLEERTALEADGPPPYLLMRFSQ
ncbi:hypothetical protein B0H14DRAFT_3531773 [Mycena olivaceomarginata]|nr:hypothetical protein B0H14DRAFT_3531773 [Mycena olivaceomarginata]